MSLRAAAMAAALLGGVCCVAAMFFGDDALNLAGVVLVLAGAGAAGATLVARGAVLRLVAAAGAAVLVLSLWTLARDGREDRLVDGVVGGLATLGVFVAALRGPRPVRGAGNH